MYVSRILVRNFRNFRLLDVPLKAGATCIVGENNTGKTNLIHAIRLVLDANMSSYYRKLTPDDFPSGADYRTPQESVVSIDLRDFADKANEEAMVADWLVANDLARLTYRFRPRRPVRQEIKGGKRPAANLTIEDYHWEICGGGTDPRTASWDQDYGTSVRFEELQQSFLVILMKPLRDVEQELRQSRASPLGRLLDAIDISVEEQAELVKILAEANDDISKSETIDALGSEISGAFDETAGEAFTMGVKVGMASPSFTDIARGLMGPGSRPYKRSREFAKFAEHACAYLEQSDAALNYAAHRALFLMLLNINGSPDWRLYSYEGRKTLFRLLLIAKRIRQSHEAAVAWLREAARAFTDVLIQEDFLSASKSQVLIGSAESMIADMVRSKVDIANVSTAEIGLYARPDQCLQLLTLHSSKGREFDAVAIVDLHEGKIPHRAASTPGEIDEARRLLYVGTTRARKLLMYFTDSSHYRNRATRFLGKDGLGLIA